MVALFWISTAFVGFLTYKTIRSIIDGEIAFREEVNALMNANPTISKSEAEAVVRAYMEG